MKKLAKDFNILTDAQIDNMMLALEAAHAETGNKNIIKVLDIITEKPSGLELKLIESEAMMYTACPCCGTRHPLVAKFGFCGKCAEIMFK